ncbi:uncharacterized protein LOC130891307 [Diorhabda carinulata]|uniref:uncharacterized protein LOC130891307 n=1 Tax=Diorhabda carinulata TaxID=1163345 RepID=UPI0025A30883|nr:uncharacterized protein LOC130891307 [Diorhabda carinulata]
MFSKRFLTLFSLLWLSIGIYADDNNPDAKPRSDFKKSLSRDCSSIYSPTCLKLDVVSLVDKLNEQDEYSVIPGVSVIREEHSDHSTTADMVTELARDFPNDPDARLDAFLMKKITSYLSSHSLRLNLLNSDAIESARKGGGGEGGGGGGKGGGGGGGGIGLLLAAGAMLKGTFFALALGAIAAIAGKALMTGLISFLLSAIIGLKALTHGHKSTTYEIVSKPVYSHSSSHSIGHEEYHPSYGHSSYGRSFDLPLPLGLQPEYKPS